MNTINIMNSALCFSLEQYYLKADQQRLLSQRIVPLTSHGQFGATPIADALAIFQRIHLEHFPSFLDIGSGDGRVALTASLFTKATGIEGDTALVREACAARDALHLSAAFIQGNYLEHDLSSYAVIFLNPDKPLYALEKKLLRMRSFHGMLIVYQDIYKPLQLCRKEEFLINGIRAGVYEG